MHPIYVPDYTEFPGLDRLLTLVPWLRVTETRSECFMADATPPLSYTYGKGSGERTYTSIHFAAGVREAMAVLNEELSRRGWGPVNVCFLNRYDSEREHLGWHADDHEGTDHTRPIAVVSFGEPREIWWRPNGEKGEVPAERRQLLADGSLFVMPPGFQALYQHRIPKGGRAMGARVSLTFRAFLGGDNAA